ncbi:NAD-binding protein [Streptomyces sp. NPDC020802]|uniref:NAD-binding protein n=1 Tax=Streptomyces sp. NPDC020802 TaxID=3365094 RepID=UPI003798C439
MTAHHDQVAMAGFVGLGHMESAPDGTACEEAVRGLMVMYAGSEENCARVEPLLAGLSDRRRRVGDRPGQPQALKLADNFLSATALAATSQAVAFGQAAGLDTAVMPEVLNTSSGRSGATADKFPDEVLTGRYRAGFSNTLMARDVRLYLGEVERLGGRAVIGSVTASVWEEFAAAEPGADFTRVHPFTTEARGTPSDS